MCLVDTSQILKHGHWPGNPRPHFLLHTVPCGAALHDSKTAQTLALQRYDITEKNVMHSNSETMNHLELVVHTLSDRCQELTYFPQLFKAFPSTLSSLLLCLGCLGSLSGNQKSNQLHQIRFFSSAAVP